MRVRVYKVKGGWSVSRVPNTYTTLEDLTSSLGVFKHVVLSEPKFDSAFGVIEGVMQPTFNLGERWLRLHYDGVEFTANRKRITGATSVAFLDEYVYVNGVK